MNTCSINFLNSFNYHQIHAMKYIYIYIYIYIYTKQNKSNLTITQNTTSITKPREKKILTTTKLQTKVQYP